jgi:curved DNA-binding protein CbpA
VSEIQKQYRSLAKLVHPDKFPDGASKSGMQKLNEAFETLSSASLSAEVMHGHC